MTTPQHMEAANVLANHQRRLVGLQVSLQNSLRQNSISKNQYDKRIREIRHQLARAKDLTAWHAADGVDNVQESALGLPDLANCTPEERHICLRFLHERRGLLEGLIKEVSKVYGWVIDASRGNGWSWLNTFKLSRLKRTIQQIELQTNGLVFDNEEHDKLLEQIAKRLNPRNTLHTKDNLEAVIKLFNNLDHISAKVAQLKEVAKKEESTVERMRSWLAQHEGQRNNKQAKIRPAAPPSITEMNDIATIRPDIDATGKRLTAARSYIEAQLDKRAN